MQNGSAEVAFANGRFDLAIPAGIDSPATEVRSARIGVERADGACSFSSEWETLEVEPLSASDRWGPCLGLKVVLALADELQVEWCAVIYQPRPLAALWMKVRNLGGQDQRLLRLFVLQILAPDRRSWQSWIRRGLLFSTMPRGCTILQRSGAFPSPMGTSTVVIGALAWENRKATPWLPESASRAPPSRASDSCADSKTSVWKMGGWLWVDRQERPLRLPPGKTFELQRMVILTAADMHRGLTEYADLVCKYLDLKLHHPPYGGIFAAYGGDTSGADDLEKCPLTEKRIETLRRVVDTHLQPYGLDTFKTQLAGLSSGPPGMSLREEWTSLPIAPVEEGLIELVYEKGFTPDIYDSRTDFPNGIEAHVRDLKRRGYRPALVCRPFLNICSGPPAYDELAAELFAMAVERWGYEYLFFDFPRHDYATTDDTHTMAQGIRSRFQAERDRVGPEIFIEASSGAGTVLGLADGFRHAGDWRGGMENWLVRMACDRYYYHQRWFQLDHEFFDPQLHPFTWGTQGEGGMTATLDRVKMWTSFGALSGFSWLTGGVIEHVSPERWWIFTRALPVYGPCAHPVDLLENDPPRVWLLEAETAGMRYQVVGFFNWSEKPQSVRIKLADLGIRDRKKYLFFSFWEQQLLGPGRRLDFELPPSSCKVFLFRSMAAEPIWIATDRHVTGAIGLTGFSYDKKNATLEGRCVGPPHTDQFHYIYLPEGLMATSSQGTSLEVPQYRLLKVGVRLDGTGAKSWSVQLQSRRKIL